MEEIIQREANQLAKALHPVSLRAPLLRIIEQRQAIWYAPTRGYYVNVAKFGEDRPVIQIWYDYTLSNEAPAFWVGFGAEDPNTVERLLEDCRSEFPAPMEFPYDAWNEQQGLGDEALQKVLANPVQEFHQGGNVNGFGIYGEPGDDTLDLQRALDFIGRVLRSLPEFAAMAIARDIEEIKNSNLNETEREALIAARLGQGQFRRGLEDMWGNQCAVLGCSTREVLRASHIKPWSECENGNERLDPNNGLLLAAHLDALFDRGLISFNDDRSMMISDRIDEAERQRLNLGGSLRQEPSDAMKAYLNYHRTRHGFAEE
jgi:hypothetical protein